MSNEKKTDEITIEPNRQDQGDERTVQISGKKVDMSIRTIVLDHPEIRYAIVARRIDSNTVEINTKRDYRAGGYNVIGLDHSEVEVFNVLNGYLIS